MPALSRFFCVTVFMNPVPPLVDALLHSGPIWCARLMVAGAMTLPIERRAGIH